MSGHAVTVWARAWSFLGSGACANSPCVSRHAPSCANWWTKTGECSHLAVLTRAQAFYVDQVDTSASLRVSTGIGTMAPLHCTALGKVLLAFGDIQPAAELPVYTPQTITDATELARQLERTRELGYALDDEEYTVGVRCLAAPCLGGRRRAGRRDGHLRPRGAFNAGAPARHGPHRDGQRAGM